jgi:hypothetical protein
LGGVVHKLTLVLVAVLLAGCGRDDTFGFVGTWSENDQLAVEIGFQNWCIDTGGAHCPVLTQESSQSVQWVYGPISGQSAETTALYDPGGAFMGDSVISIRYDAADMAEGEERTDWITCVTMHELVHHFGVDDIRSEDPIRALAWKNACSVDKVDPVVSSSDQDSIPFD